MAELIARSPCGGLLPLTVAEISLTEEAATTLTSITPYRGQQMAVSKVLQTAHGLSFPEPGRMTGMEGARAVWFGHGQMMLIGPEPDQSLRDVAALTDQSDAWAVVRLEGRESERVLARLVPVDLRAAVFKPGQTVRSQLMHMAVAVTRVGDQTFQIMAFRSMAVTLIHDLKTAMEAVAARG